MGSFAQKQVEKFTIESRDAYKVTLVFGIIFLRDLEPKKKIFCAINNQG